MDLTRNGPSGGGVLVEKSRLKGWLKQTGESLINAECPIVSMVMVKKWVNA